MFFAGAVCNKKTGAECFRGKLRIKGICMNYVIEVLEGDLNRLNLTNSWVDENDGTEYRNVFSLENKCIFPDIEEGAEFYFTLRTDSNNDCLVCEAYRPVPAAKNNIAVTQNPCR